MANGFNRDGAAGTLAAMQGAARPPDHDGGHHHHYDVNDIVNAHSAHLGEHDDRLAGHDDRLDALEGAHHDDRGD